MLEKKFIGGINTDDADRDLEMSVRDCFNLVPQDKGMGESPRRENSKGNKAVSTVTRPAGTNKTIGRFTDKDDRRLFEFIYNSNGDHTIYVYERDKNREYTVFQTGKFNWNENSKITGAGIIKDQLVFTDTEEEIGSIDVKFGKNTFDVNENREWELLISNIDGAEFTIEYQNEDFSGGEYDVEGTTLDALVDDINANITVITAEKCGETVKITENSPSTVKSITISGSNSAAIAPTNFYPTPVTKQQISLIRYPLPCPPTGEYGTDTTRTVNSVYDEAFQFSIRYTYFDDSSSTISPYSKVLAKKDCGISSTKIDNYIEVTFNENNYSALELMLIKNVEVLFRLGNAGNFYKAVTLSRNEFFEGTYNFYNDGSYTAISDAEASKPYDFVPNKANALAILKNRLFIGGYTEGYETPCVDANVSVDIEDGISGVGSTWTITGRVRIVNRFIRSQPFLTVGPDDGLNGTSHTNQPIHSRVGDTDRENWVYGGLGGQSGGNASEGDIVASGQYIPEGGFTIYLAGTNYFGISKQVTKSYSDPVDNDATVVNEDPIVYDTSKSGNTLDENNENRRTATRRIMAEDNVYSTFEIKGVPPGTYIVRVASPLCARTENLRSDTDPFYDLNGNIADWQSTSANVIGIDSTPSVFQSNTDEFYGNGIYEKVITLGDSGGTFDLHEGTDRAILIADLIDMGKSVGIDSTERAAGNVGYLVDPDNKDEEGFAASLRMERQYIGVSYDNPLGAYDDISGNFLNASDFYTRTDHNGYFWSAINGGLWSGLVGTRVIRTLAYNGGFKNTNTFPVVDENENNNYEIKHWNQAHYDDADISDVYNGNIITKSEFKDWKSGGTNKWIMYNYNSRISDYGRTIIKGKVITPEGNPLGGLFAQTIWTSRSEKTDSEGFFNIVVYADEDLTLPDRKRSGIVLIGKGTNACVSFSDKSVGYDAQPISDGNFNNANPFITDDVVVDDLVINTSSTYKRGGVFKWGLIYYDEALRSSFVATKDDLRKRMPFITDDLGVILPEQYSSPTFKYGSPVISWDINSQPPEWAHYYQWVRTKDTAFRTFLTWSASKILYVKEWDLETEEPVETTFNSSTANEIYIDTSNFDQYTNKNSDAQIGYNFAIGDRLIIIKNDGEYLEEYVDVEVKGQRGQYIIIENLGSIEELKEGLQFQVYTPRLQNEDEVFYEIGECYKVLNPGTESREHETTSGTFVRGDIYSIGRNIDIDGGAVTDNYEHPTISDKETEGFSDIGRVNAENKNAKTNYFYSNVRFSNPFVQDSFINGLSSFETANKEPLPLERGPISSMIGTTNTILVIHKTECTSLYIGEGFLSTANGGTDLLSKTSGVIGDERLLKGEYGTLNPESVVEYNDAIYFWDQSKGEMVRYSNDGLTPLGLVYKYKNKLLEIQEFKKQNTVNNIDNSVYGGFNPLLDMAIMSFKNINGEDITIAFHERNDAFMTRFAFSPDSYGYIDTKLYSMKNGILYEHDVDDVPRNNFYGVQYNSSAHIVSADHLERLYNTIGVSSNNVWSMTKMFNKNGQDSDLLKTDFVNRDGMYYADVLRDKNTALDTLSPGQTPLIHGKEMRSQVMEIIVENDNSEKTEIDFIVLGIQESPGHLINE